MMPRTPELVIALDFQTRAEALDMARNLAPLAASPGALLGNKVVLVPCARQTAPEHMHAGAADLNPRPGEGCAARKAAGTVPKVCRRLEKTVNGSVLCSALSRSTLVWRPEQATFVVSTAKLEALMHAIAAFGGSSTLLIPAV